MTDARLITWFRQEPLPTTLAPPAVVLGGTGLLREFLAIASRIDGPGDIAIAAPYVGRGVADELRAWEALPHDVLDLRVVTQSTRDAAVAVAELGKFRWRSVLITVHLRLHAKLYAVVGPRGGACLVGSHNLTPGGARTNHEAGVLFIGGGDPEVEQIVCACRGHIIDLGSGGTTVLDSLSWKHKVA